MLKKLTLTLFGIILFLAVIYNLLASHTRDSTAVQNQASTQKVIHWKMANTWTEGMPVIHESTLRFAENVKKLTGGRLVIKVHSSNKHKAPFGIFDMVRSGQYELGHTAAYYWKGKDPATPMLTTTPFGMNAWEQYSWFYRGGGQKLQQKVFKKHGLLAFPAGNTGVQMGGWFKKPIESLKDMQGLKMRIPGMGGDVIAEVGAKPVNIPAGELYTALQLGTIDALEWIGPAIDVNMGFQQVANYYYTGWHEPAAELQFLVNPEKFNTLPKDIQFAVKLAMREAAYDMSVHFIHANAAAWKSMKTKHPNVEIKSFPDDVYKALKDKTQVVLDKVSKKSAMAKEVIESQRDYYELIKVWTDVSDKAYLVNR
jgi:TRAP-type mannitol/chloroaromatic compound transport system substrate-binding protein